LKMKPFSLTAMLFFTFMDVFDFSLQDYLLYIV
jgi:hypothetical protein